MIESETLIAVEMAHNIASVLTQAVHRDGGKIDAITQALVDHPHGLEINSWAHIYGQIIFIAPVVSHALHGDTSVAHVRGVMEALQQAVINYIKTNDLPIT